MDQSDCISREAASRAKPPGGSTQAHDNEFVHWAEAARSRP